MIQTQSLTLGEHYVTSAWQKQDDSTQEIGTAVLLPGYLDSKDYQQFIQLGDELAPLGVTAYGIDPYGTWQSQGQIGDYTVTNYIDQVVEVVEEVAESSLPCFLIGHSLGGFIASFAAEKLPQVKGIVVIMSPSTFVRPENEYDRLVTWRHEQVRQSKRPLPDDLTSFRRYFVPANFVDDAQPYDTTTALSRLSIPKLFIAGGEDQLISPEYMASYVALASEPKEFVTLPGVVHNYREDQKQIAEVNRHVLQYVQHVLS